MTLAVKYPAAGIGVFNPCGMRQMLVQARHLAHCLWESDRSARQKVWGCRMLYDFEKDVDRRNTHSLKWDVKEHSTVNRVVVGSSLTRGGRKSP